MSEDDGPQNEEAEVNAGAEEAVIDLEVTFPLISDDEDPHTMITGTICDCCTSATGTCNTKASCTSACC